jgi:hypothetical protein
MVRPKKRIPKKGDRVAVPGHSGAFLIYGLDTSLCTAELRRIGSTFALSTIPWDALTFVDELEAS